MENWDRTHDRVIAEQCEGWTAIVGDGQAMRKAGGDGVYVPRYSTDLVAVVRAAEAWRKQEPDKRTWLLRSQDLQEAGPIIAQLDLMLAQTDRWGDETSMEYHGNHWKTHRYIGNTPAEALAWALYKAVTS